MNYCLKITNPRGTSKIKIANDRQRDFIKTQKQFYRVIFS